MPPLLTPFLQRERYKYAAPYVRGKVLDLGCGHAGVLNWADGIQDYIGVEGAPQFLNWLNSHYPQYRFLQRNLDLEALNLDSQFDTILLIAVIEHLEKPLFLLKQIPKYLNPGGKLVITTPTLLGDKIHQAVSRLGLVSQVAAKEHATIFTHQTLTTLLKKAGLSVTYYRRFLLGGNQLFVCQPEN